MDTRVPPIKEFPKDERYWRVDWFGAVERNPGVPSESSIQVVISQFRENPYQLPTKELATNRQVNHKTGQHVIAIGIGQLPGIELGSIWKNGVRQDIHAGIQHTQTLDISPDTVTVIPANFREQEKPLIPITHYRYGSVGVRSQLLAVRQDGDPFGYLIPMMELLRFYYAVSSKLSHIIFSGDFTHNLSSIVNEERIKYLTEEKRFLLGLRQHLDDEDSWTISRILHSEQAWNGCTEVHNQLMKQSLNNDLIHIKTRFPFEGCTDLRARGKFIPTHEDGKWRFLALSLEHCSAPFPFENLTIIRDNDNSKAPAESDILDKDKKSAFPQQKTHDEYSDKELQSNQEPDKEQSIVTIPLPADRFGALEGKKPDKPTKEQCNYRNSGKFKPPGSDSIALGTGLGHYVDNGVQGASLTAHRERRHGLSASQAIFKEAIQELDCRSRINARIRDHSRYLEFVPLTKPKSSWQWSYLDSPKKIKRTVVVGDIEFHGSWYSLIEFDLRNGERRGVGLISAYDGQLLSDRSLNILLYHVARKDGVWANSEPYHGLDIQIETLRHTWSSVGKFADSVERKITGISCAQNQHIIKA
jgi:hypothetical protein